MWVEERDDLPGDRIASLRAGLPEAVAWLATGPEGGFVISATLCLGDEVAEDGLRARNLLAATALATPGICLGKESGKETIAAIGRRHARRPTC
jgi:hypothetical protein